MLIIKYLLCSSCSSSLLPPTWYADYEEDVPEEVDYVQIDVEGSEDVFLRTEGVGMISSHHQLGVVDQITGEYESSANTDPDHHLFGVGKEVKQEVGDDDIYQNSK